MHPFSSGCGFQNLILRAVASSGDRMWRVSVEFSDRRMHVASRLRFRNTEIFSKNKFFAQDAGNCWIRQGKKSVRVLRHKSNDEEFFSKWTEGLSHVFILSLNKGHLMQRFPKQSFQERLEKRFV